MYILKALLNKPHSYLAQNISAATILPGECTEKQNASGWLTLPRWHSHQIHVQGLGPAGAAAEVFFFLEHKKLNFGSPERFSRPSPEGQPIDLEIKKIQKIDLTRPRLSLI